MSKKSPSPNGPPKPVLIPNMLIAIGMLNDLIPKHIPNNHILLTLIIIF